MHISSLSTLYRALRSQYRFVGIVALLSLFSLFLCVVPRWILWVLLFLLIALTAAILHTRRHVSVKHTALSRSVDSIHASLGILSSLRSSCPCDYCRLPVDLQGEICQHLSFLQSARLRHVSHCWNARFEAGLHLTPCSSARYVVAFGGLASDELPLDTVELFDTARGQWSSDNAPMRQKRSHHAAASLGGAIYVLGGGQWGVERTAERYDIAADRWTNISEMAYKREGPAAAPMRGHLYVMGGRSNAVEEYDPGTDRWIGGPDLSVTWMRPGASAVSLNDTVYFLERTACFRLDDRTAHWHRLDAMPTKRRYFAAAATQDSVYAIGGTYSQTTVERYDVRAERWATELPMRVGGGVGMAAVTTDQDEILVLGGGRSVLFDAQRGSWDYGPPLCMERSHLAAVGV
eukprot:gnl/Trimastix_PCT/1620.p1 GENE.gnl/Trimastix_PCT/1620~~gnl/Trimastix_PCT/1620.p1  ORF type:complete len:405 (+),score=49.98 gnl/Trimastix_PCT/1620:71-1285(+)